jgi:dTDP-4-amino-4,6-dideoxygalactose transaminase
MSAILSMPDADRLAVSGGQPIIPRGQVQASRWPRISADDIEGLVAQLKSGLLTEMSGRQQLRDFETNLAMLTGTRHAIATNSGTAALHAALAGLGVGPGDEVVVPSLTYIACGAAVVHQNAIPVFADVDPVTYNVTPATVEAAITPHCRAIMVVHLHGLPADMDGLREVARRHGLPILEDFSQAVGAQWRDRPVGGLGTVAAASLMAGKNLASAGEGGVMVTNDRELHNRAAAVKCFGEAVDAGGGHSLIHGTLGYNYRINLLSALMVGQQLFRLDDHTAARRDNARRLGAVLEALPGFHPPREPEGAQHAYHMYRFRIDPAAAGLSITADQAREGLRQVFWGEGLPLVEFQNQPLPGHDLFQGRVGYGRGCPWSCVGRPRPDYRIEAFPGALAAIRDSLVIGLPAQATIADAGAVDAYIRCFHKVHANLGDFERFAAGLPSTAPWQQPARLF